MSNIKGLYFKLNMDKDCDRKLFDFFEKESKFQEFSKIELLWKMMSAYLTITEKTFISQEDKK